MIPQQNTDAWLEFRKDKVGGSDAPIIMGDSPWKTPFQLWEEKLGLSGDSRPNFAMRRGTEMEPIALAAYNAHTMRNAQPEVVVDEFYDWRMASLDGLSEDRTTIVEIKCPGEQDHALAAKGQIPKKYYAQLQHQLAVSDASVLHYFSFRNDSDFHLIEVGPDSKYINNLLDKELKFITQVREWEAPELSERDFIVRNDDVWLEAVSRFQEVSCKLKDLEAKQKEMRNELISMCNGKATQGGGVKLSQHMRKGAINYKAIPELDGLDLEKYRRKPTTYWRVG